MGGVLVGGAHVYSTHWAAGKGGERWRRVLAGQQKPGRGGKWQRCRTRWAAEAGVVQQSQTKARARREEWHTICIKQGIKNKTTFL